jgi:hypothetical protein
MGILKGEPFDRSQYEQQWPLPLSLDKSLPRPWYVAAYSGAALGNVLRSDYGATYRDGVFSVDGGEMLRVYKSGDLYGTHGGTLFVLYDPKWGSQTELHRICEVAHDRGIRIEVLPDRQAAEHSQPVNT